MTAEYSYLTMTAGPRNGTHYALRPGKVHRLGRGMDCDVVLADPLCSRVHAELFYEGGAWWVRDAGSRNGTFLDDAKIGRSRLAAGTRIRTGSTEFTFQTSDQPPTAVESWEGAELTESIVRQAAVDSEDSGRVALAALRRSDNAIDLGRLFKLSLQLLTCDEPHDVLQRTLEAVHERTSAGVVGFLWVTDARELKPQVLVPMEAAARARLSESLTTLVLEQRRAVWVAHQSSAASADSLKPFADAVCVPVIHGGNTLGAIHMYLGQGRFRDIDFEFAISVAQLLAAALARSRRQAILTASHQRLWASSAASDELLGNSAAMRKLRERIAKVAVAQGCVLISGESGSGKELVAGAVHRSSRRADRPLLAVNCAAIPENLVESQLFGHVRGAFTGATTDRVGWFRQADTGTLFLDEIGELPWEAQGKLLRILENHPFLPVGGTLEVTADVRILAATNRDLRELVRAKTFREDLYYRLSVFDLRVPPLREREGDIELLLDHFLNHFRTRHGRPGLQLSPQARQRMLDYPWPGNVRQLRNVVDSAVVMASGGTIEVEDVGLHDAGTDALESLRLSDWEKKLIRLALRQTADNVPAAAHLLGIGRATLYRKIEEYQIPRR